MLKYNILKTEDNILFYHYYSEINGCDGVVSINKNTGETSIVKSSDNDLGNRFAYKLIKRLKSFFENSNYSDNGIVSWY